MAQFDVKTTFSRVYEYSAIIEADTAEEAQELARAIDGDTEGVEATDYDTDIEIVSLARVDYLEKFQEIWNIADDPAKFREYVDGSVDGATADLIEKARGIVYADSDQDGLISDFYYLNLLELILLRRAEVEKEEMN